ncbi:MAG: hypothetical protein V2B18_24710 [Pseudomonadota bacterium]
MVAEISRTPLIAVLILAFASTGIMAASKDKVEKKSSDKAEQVDSGRHKSVISI